MSRRPPLPFTFVVTLTGSSTTRWSHRPFRTSWTTSVWPRTFLGCSSRPVRLQASSPLRSSASWPTGMGAGSFSLCASPSSGRLVVSQPWRQHSASCSSPGSCPSGRRTDRRPLVRSGADQDRGSELGGRFLAHERCISAPICGTEGTVIFLYLRAVHPRTADALKSRASPVPLRSPS